MFERQSKLKPAHTARCGLVFLWGGFPIPLSCGVTPRLCLVVAPRSCGYFYETIKVAKSVFKRRGPLENLLWGTPRSGLCVYDTRSRGVIPAVTFGHAPLLHLGSFLRQQGGTCPLGHCGGSRHREAVTFPPRGFARGCPLHTLLLTFLV